MEAAELLKKVRKIEIKTRMLTNQVFAGEYHSTFKGRGMAFSEVREYQYGDDIRNIDWNVTARFNHPYIKVYEEERELTVMILIDVSHSGMFGTRKMLKKDMFTELAAVLSFSAIKNNDKVGVIFFSDKVEKFIPPKKGKTHILRIISEILTFKPVSGQTNLNEALRYFNNVTKKKSTCFILSDFLDGNFEKALRIASGKHDIIALRIFDEREKTFPKAGHLSIEDSETGKIWWVNTSDKRIQQHFEQWWIQKETELKETFSKCGVDHLSLPTDKDYVKPLIKLFKARRSRI